MQHRVLAVLVLAQMGTHAGHQLAQAERLGDVVVGAGIEAADGVSLAVNRGQHDDRGRDLGPAHLPAQLAPVAVRQADVQQDDVELPGLGLLQPLGRGRRFGRLELAVQRQLLGQRPAQVVIVVDQQDFLGRGSGHGAPLRCLSCPWGSHNTLEQRETSCFPRP